MVFDIFLNCSANYQFAVANFFIFRRRNHYGTRLFNEDSFKTVSAYI